MYCHDFGLVTGNQQNEQQQIVCNEQEQNDLLLQIHISKVTNIIFESISVTK
jgi:hypothetical protein